MNALRLAAALLALLPSALRAQTVFPAGGPPAVRLWTGRAPGALGDSAIDQPSITPYLPAAGTGNGAAAVVFAGGGYSHIAFEKEGIPAARWLNSLGIAAFVVQYRIGPRYHHPVIMGDGLRAVRLVRARAAEWGLDPNRVGVVGFSAGGHLASSVGTHFDAGSATSADPVERASSRPDFMILVYPVITLRPELSHRTTRTMVLGPAQADTALEHFLSSETQVTAATPPTFIVATADDAAVPVENEIMFYRALHAARVPVEMHLFETGRHGFGLAPDNPVLSQWPALCALWLEHRGLLARTGK